MRLILIATATKEARINDIGNPPFAANLTNLSEGLHQGEALMAY